jgi:hypothetical protein
MVVRKIIVVTTSTLAILFILGCSPSPTANARGNFLDSFGGISGVLRTWNCGGATTKGKDAEVVRCEFMIHGGYVNTMVKYCSTKPKDGCGYTENGAKFFSQESIR